MRKTPFWIALILTIFAGYLFYDGKEEAGALVLGSAVAASQFAQDDREDELIDQNQSLKTEVALLKKESEYKNKLAEQKLNYEFQLFEQKLKHREEFAKRDEEAYLLEAEKRFKEKENRKKALPEAKSSEYKLTANFGEPKTEDLEEYGEDQLNG